jgi:ribA/ribD-fused uncharacterized protein
MQVHEMIRNFFPEYYSIERYPAEQTVCIRKTKDEWGVFGNFYRTPIVVNGVTFDCTERLFHLMKFKPDATEGIREQMDVHAGQRIKMHMKSIYKNHPEWFHDHWPTMVVDAMKYCLTLKYEQCELFRNELQRSSGMFIVEDETARKLDTWGAVLLEEEDEYVGPNLLGRLLMELRDNGKLEYTLPDDALDFINVLK